MKVLVYGSINYDYVYSVDHFVSSGETLTASSLQMHLGGKGLNQSIAVARSGGSVFLGGMIGTDGDALLEACKKDGVNTDFVGRSACRNGHAIIQLNAQGENCIFAYTGSNFCQTSEHIRETLDHFEAGDYLMLQNEVNQLEELINYGYERKLRIVLNPSPYNAAVAACDLQKVSILMINEIEGGQITGRQIPEEILTDLAKRYPSMDVVLTLGGDGAMYKFGTSDEITILKQKAFPVEVADTTGAGDTFAGFFVSALAGGMNPSDALKIACKAGALACTKEGAVDGIPYRSDVMALHDITRRL